MMTFGYHSLQIGNVTLPLALGAKGDIVNVAHCDPIQSYAIRANPPPTTTLKLTLTLTEALAEGEQCVR